MSGLQEFPTIAEAIQIKKNKKSGKSSPATSPVSSSSSTSPFPFCKEELALFAELQSTYPETTPFVQSQLQMNTDLATPNPQLAKTKPALAKFIARFGQQCYEECREYGAQDCFENPDGTDAEEMNKVFRILWNDVCLEQGHPKKFLDV